ncbi:MAG: hypothetical protein IJ391_08485 [Clostridia bacterium]|nr:hypothetical protein [Clostridia bacterium]
MKRHILKTVLALLCVTLLVFAVSCKEKLDVGKMLGYQSGTPEYDLILRVGDAVYPMHITLKGEGEQSVRDGSAAITGGVLDGVGFEMTGGKLKMTVGELEYMLEKKDSSPLYFLFEAFALKEDGFIGATEETGSGVLVAHFDGGEELTLTLSADTYEPIMIESLCETGVCSVDFGSNVKEN